ncbi:hypothetical protein K8Z61_06615 [Nocardioides sp. TRM66260-LWL]|uniref:hypothetical protein n=1 Tax=Nocardioides sp. TRM66260-LWL TaxID=2874478 RepID=UPI001CC63412|nr:hypothetical protein [Nocardioides sp. TRM66260-LWL]MBZ5734164.1 hypothetical protein [Nocardioides sp. TRM66260-LWL]
MITTIRVQQIAPICAVQRVVPTAVRSASDVRTSVGTWVGAGNLGLGMTGARAFAFDAKRTFGHPTVGPAWSPPGC